MPPAKKAAKKAAKSFEEKSGKELRRAYEHTSRVEILQRLLPPGTADAIATLVAYACRELDGKKNREAADLLRASEHLSFAALALPGQANAPLSPELSKSNLRSCAGKPMNDGRRRTTTPQCWRRSTAAHERRRPPLMKKGPGIGRWSLPALRKLWRI
jgi:hypothetical protein